MPAPAEEYPALARYRLELPVDAIVHEAGLVPAFFYMVLSGRVVLEVVDARGVRSTVGQVQPGGLVAVVSTFSGRPTDARARVTVRSVLLAVPFSAAASAFQQAPEFAITVVRQLAAEGGAGSAERAPSAGSMLAPQSAAQAVPGVESSAALVGSPLATPFNEHWFFKADVRCPACQGEFSLLRVRASAVRPAGRDSDFRIAYETVDPSLYAVTVCPRCAYAAYTEDFADLAPNERRAILETQAARAVLVSKNLCGERDLSDAMLTLVLAQMCADVRGARLRRQAGLLHRRAWLERSRGNAEAERALLQRTRDAYLAVFEQDRDVQDSAAVRVAYLLGDLSLRLGDITAGRRWLLECTRMPAAREQAGLLRMARLRLADASAAVGFQRSA